MYYGATSKIDGEPRFQFIEPDFTNTEDYIEGAARSCSKLHKGLYGT